MGGGRTLLGGGGPRTRKHDLGHDVVHALAAQLLRRHADRGRQRGHLAPLLQLDQARQRGWQDAQRQRALAHVQQLRDLACGT